MARVFFTPNLRRHVELPSGNNSPGETVRAVLDGVFVNQPSGRGYVLDEQSALRKHMIVFIDGQPIQDRIGLSDPVGPESEVYVMQALSGG
jgi:hypothetical protein